PGGAARFHRNPGRAGEGASGPRVPARGRADLRRRLRGGAGDVAQPNVRTLLTTLWHSLPGRPLEEGQGLEGHLTQTAALAEGVAESVAPGWGRVAGLWHDAGKYRRAFQERIKVEADAHTNGNVDHSSVGALIARERKAPLVAFVVAGHHGGLQNAEDVRTRL